jgi:hypothetical protein
MSYWKQTEVIDIYGNLVAATPNQEMRTVEPIRLAGGIFPGSTVDSNFWTSTVVGSGTVTQSNGIQTAATGITANSSAISSSKAIARYIGQTLNLYGSQIYLSDTGVVNNVRRWGGMNAGTDGAYFKLDGTSLYVATMKGGVETAVVSTSWNGVQTVPTLTNANIWRIQMRPSLVNFEINGVVAHTLTFNTTPWTNIYNMYVWMDTVNSSGLTTNCAISSWASSIFRAGKFETQPTSAHVTTAATTVIKYGAGTLHRITLNNPGGTLITMYDNTAGSGTVIAEINTPAQANPVTLEYDTAFVNGLTIVSTGTWDATVVYE